MGGAYFEVGNITPAAEFNIYVDPEAAEIVYQVGAPITVIPLDVTHKALVKIRAMMRFVIWDYTRWIWQSHEMTDFFERFDKEKYGTAGRPCMIRRSLPI
jgi:purine nucleosidase